MTADSPDGGDGGDADRSDALRGVQIAALERALVSPHAADRYLSLAGGLETARRVSRLDGADAPSEPLSSALLCLTVLRTSDEDEGEGPAGRLPAAAWTPGGPDPERTTSRRERHVRLGALLAHERLGVTIERAAALAGLSPEDLRAVRRRRWSRTPSK